MFITVHAATAMVVGSKIQSAPLAFLISFLLHFVFDIIPHGDKELGKKFFGLDLRKFREHDDFRAIALYGTLDACFLAVFLAFMFKNFAFVRDDTIIWAIIGGILPDILVAFYKLTNSKYLRWFYNLHNRNHLWLLDKMKKDLSVKLGIIWQATVWLLMVFLLFYL